MSEMVEPSRTRNIETWDVPKNLEQLLGREFTNHQLPQALVVLSGGIQPDRTSRAEAYNDGYRSPSYQGADRTGLASGGKVRVVAAAEVGKRFSDITLVTTSKVEPDRPSHASVMATELRQRGIPEQQIVLEEISHDTVTEMAELMKLVDANQWTRVAIVTNAYHIPRAQAMLDRIDSILRDTGDEAFQVAIERLRSVKGEFHFVAAEELLEAISPHYEALFSKVRTMPAYAERLAAEARGRAALENGTYQHQPRPRQ